MYSYNETMYRKSINNSPDFHTSIEEFLSWLTRYEEMDTFLWQIWHYKNAETEEATDWAYQIAWDYSIPVSMVKYFRNAMNEAILTVR